MKVAVVLSMALLVLAFPAMAEVVIDGTATPGEWSEADVIKLENGGEAMLLFSDDSLQIAVRGPDDGWAHVYLSSGDHIRVLHASAAIGTAEYRRDGDHWTAVREFEWGVRDRTMSDSARAERREHLEREGWVASTNGMGEGGLIEFRIDRTLINNDARLAIVYAASADAPQYWPPTLADATLDEQLIFGTTPERLAFDPEQWSAARAERDRSRAGY